MDSTKMNFKAVKYSLIETIYLTVQPTEQKFSYFYYKVSCEPSWIGTIDEKSSFTLGLKD